MYIKQKFCFQRVQLSSKSIQSADYIPPDCIFHRACCILRGTSEQAGTVHAKMIQAALRQSSHIPHLELKLPPPNCCAYSEIAARAQTSHVLAISPRDKGSVKLRREILSFDFTFAERSSSSLLPEQQGGQVH